MNWESESESGRPLTMLDMYVYISSFFLWLRWSKKNRTAVVIDYLLMNNNIIIYIFKQDKENMNKTIIEKNWMNWKQKLKKLCFPPVWVAEYYSLIRTGVSTSSRVNIRGVHTYVYVMLKSRYYTILQFNI